MSHTLHCDFKVRSNRGPIYWWPILFDLMYRHSFDFSSPSLPQGNSIFFWTHPLEGTYATGLEEGPFKSLWDKVYENERTISVTAWFWHPESDPLPLEVYISAYASEEMVSIRLSFEGVYVMEVTPDIARQRLRRVLDCARSLSDVAQPATGEVYWLFAGYSYAPWAAFGKLLEPPSDERPSYGELPPTLLEETLPSGAKFYLLDPVPIPVRGELAFTENDKPKLLYSGGNEWQFLLLNET